MSNRKPGFWRRLERSIRKRKRRLFNFLMPDCFIGSGAKGTHAAIYGSDLTAGSPPKSPDHALQAQNLGMNIEMPCVRKVTVGIVTFNQTDLEIQQVVATAKQALASQFCDKQSRVLILDNGRATAHATGFGDGVTYVSSRGNIGFGAGQNILMAEAFKSQIDLYIAANPDGRFHPDSIGELIRMVSAHGDRALIEAIQFPDEHPKAFNLETFDTPWVSGACLAVHRRYTIALAALMRRFSCTARMSTFPGAPARLVLRRRYALDHSSLMR